ncbi:heterocyst frequency control protein PatD [Gloeocapsopsis crepidinum LEGE 06123]|uniref:Heterocyst frequency control protein PatD n=1 Tax=Gloeocapsopsis crepidinum LEGE 06123 TaxID=588587 RepID=A0ABR9UX37_9CHRO|nr:heterocyst frequency control protein PatD [Gloeocapsopsis crepidinum]MBE9192846.1 heterocyst frequency control protein PatD [Gloeocapsopsis crepidinum LEGE 06123]
MLSNFHYQSYQEFAAVLKQLQANANRAQPDVVKLHEVFQQAQRLFGQQIITLDSSDLEPSVASRVRSYHTEIDKQLKLLRMDMTFLQAARQPETIIARKEQICLRIQTLINYCNVLLEVSA